jgi:hypothetical protein
MRSTARSCRSPVDNASDHIALALYRADHWRLAGADATATGRIVISVPFMLVVRLAADKSFVNLDNTAELLDVLDQRSTDLSQVPDNRPKEEVGSPSVQPR